MIAVLVITDGRPYLAETIESARANLVGPVTRWIMYDDTGDSDHRAQLAETFPAFEHINAGPRQGFGGAIRASWRHLATLDEPFVFHLEQDFTFNQPVPLSGMAQVLDNNPHLVQLALRRQPWNDEEIAAGGIVEQHPEDFTEVADDFGRVWLEHRRFFTTNPSLYRRDLVRRPWPRGSQSEGRFTHMLLASPKVRFGYWGAMDSGEWVTHTGHERVGVGY